VKEKDPIIEELHRIREAHARKFNYDLHAMFDDLRRKQARRRNLSDLKPVKPVVPCVAEERAVYRTRGPKTR
jgi:hypothetical protein